MLDTHPSSIARHSLNQSCQIPSTGNRKPLHDASSRVNMTKTMKPMIHKKHNNENEEPKFSMKRIGDKEDPQDAYDYDLEVYITMKTDEDLYLADTDLFDLQSTITPKMRATVIDWLVEVHGKMGFHTDTLYLTVNLMDRFLSQCDIDKSTYQRYGCAALLIAAKNLELYPPSLKDLVRFADDSFTSRLLSKSEAQILIRLDFKVNPFLSSTFLKRYLRLLQPDFHLSMLGHYILETTIIDQSFIGDTPSKVAAAACFLAVTLYRGKGHWNKEVEADTRYSFADLTDMIQKLLNCVNTSATSKFSAVRRKYSGKEMDRISSTEFPKTVEELMQKC